MMPHVLTRSLDRSATVFLLVVAAFGVLIPLSNLLLPAGSMLQVPTYLVALFGKYVCYAILALAIDLIWGYCGILSLGHGAFFALGGYAMGMYLMRSIGRDGVYKSDLPDFMVFLDWKELPWFWHGTEHFAWAMLLVILVPGVLAWLFGFFAFRSRVKGVYLSIITQAMTYAAMLLFFRNETGFGGNNGFTDFKRILGFPISALPTRTVLFVATFVALVLAFIAAVAIMVMADIGSTATCEDVFAGKADFNDDNECYDGSSTTKLIALVLGWPGAILAAVSVLLALGFAIRGYGGRTLLQVIIAAAVLLGLSLIIG